MVLDLTTNQHQDLACETNHTEVIAVHRRWSDAACKHSSGEIHDDISFVSNSQTRFMHEHDVHVDARLCLQRSSQGISVAPHTVTGAIPVCDVLSFPSFPRLFVSISSPICNLLDRPASVDGGLPPHMGFAALLKKPQISYI